MLFLVILTDIASLVSQLSLVAEGIRINISRSPKISAVQIDLLVFAKLPSALGSFLKSGAGRTERLFGLGARVTVTVCVDVFIAEDARVEVNGGGEDKDEPNVKVEQIETADIVLLLIEIEGVELKV